MTATPLLGFELITQDVRVPATTGAADGVIVDISIPPGGFVAGSGCVVTEVWSNSANGLVAIDSMPTVDGGTNVAAAEACGFLSHDGPHPSDSSKWRFELFDNGNISRVRLWITVLTGPGA